MDFHAVGRLMLPSEAYAIHEENLKNCWEEFGPLARNRMMLGAFVRSSDYLQAQRFRRELADAGEDRSDGLLMVPPGTRIRSPKPQTGPSYQYPVPAQTRKPRPNPLFQPLGKLQKRGHQLYTYTCKYARR